MEFNNVNDCVPEVTLVEGKSTYELMRDAHVAELVEIQGRRGRKRRTVSNHLQFFSNNALELLQFRDF
jgi:hypothetical protein